MPTNKTLFLLIVACAVVFGFLATASPAYAASSQKVLYSFCSAKNCIDGVQPYAPVVFDHAGNLYGTTGFGGANKSGCGGVGCGTVFELTPGSNGKWSEKVLYSFCSASNCADGAQPSAGVTFDAAGNLYGTTEMGGSYNAGTVFQLAPNHGKWVARVLHSFNPNDKDGTNPWAGLVVDRAGNLYGTTQIGGVFPCSPTSGCGTVFELIPNGGKWTCKVVFNFNGTDGAFVLGGLTPHSSGSFYGITSGGGTNDAGVVFEVTPHMRGWTEKVLSSFDYQGGWLPQSVNPTFDATGNLYGTTYLGGAYGGGTVFELLRKGHGWAYKVLHDFDYKTGDGASPWAGLTLGENGTLYGTTKNGGTAQLGTLFALTFDDGKWTEKLLHSFSGKNGSAPFSSLTLDQAGHLYGTTVLGGSNLSTCGGDGCGTVFEVVP
jgi:uncharacterized repeat protein (TIGR03803 family)